jgi:hypothetical protein
LTERGTLPAVDVSVIVPTRNRSALLSQTLRSVLWQRGVDFEVIVVDEASTDDTLEVIAGFADARIRVIRNDSPTGVAAARNRGAADARGEWLAFVDDDDLWAPDKLRLQLQEAEALGRDWAYAGAVVIDADSRITRAQPAMPADWTVSALRRYHAIPGGASNVIVRRPAWHQTGPFDARMPISADWELYIRLARHGLPACVPRPLVARRIHGSNLSLDVTRIVSEIRLIETLHQTKADWGMLRRWMAHSCLRAGQRRAALGQFARAAAGGAWGAVVADLSVILSETTGRYLHGPRPHRPPARDAWIAAASTWLDELRGAHTGGSSTS